MKISMQKLNRAFNTVRDELEEVGLLADDVYLDAIELYVTQLPAFGRLSGYVYDERVPFWDRIRGFEGGAIYIPPNSPDRPYAPGLTLTDTVRHEFAHAWAWLDRDFIDQPWFFEAFEGDYDEIRPSDKKVADALKKFMDQDPKGPFRTHGFADCFFSSYAMTAVKEDFAETFMCFLKYRRSLERFQKRAGLYRKLLAVEKAVKRKANDIKKRKPGRIRKTKPDYPAKFKLNIQAEPQVDGHTCGYRSASSVYKYYGLSPKEMELRIYLGTDHLLPYTVPCRDQIEEWMGGVDHGLSGTSPMDMFATLWWDGFDLQVAKTNKERYTNELREHLSLGHPALCLMHNIFHWVVINGYDETGFWIVDSIKWTEDMWEGGPLRRKYRLPCDEFHSLQRGILMVWRQEQAQVRDMRRRDFLRLYWQGLQFTASAAGKAIPSTVGAVFRR